ncbi:hypothetical protein C8J57DRAFT_1484587 [Mycena rebaudengoi]|nr:hypothetical protein C8J57DRAFT_1484587 [Mycena rebaudengoi]
MLVVKAIVQDLLVEVLSRVLRIALKFLVAGWPLYAGEPTVLQGVCRHWNDVLSADSAVWVEKWLQRSKGPSLFVYINITVGWLLLSRHIPHRYLSMLFSMWLAGLFVAELRLQDMWDPIDVRQSELVHGILPVVGSRGHAHSPDTGSGDRAVASGRTCDFDMRAAFRTVVAAALTLRGATSMEFDAIVCDCRRSGSGTAESLLEIGSGVYGRFPLLSLVVADSRTRNSGSELAKLLLGGGVFVSSFDLSWALVDWMVGRSSNIVWRDRLRSKPLL